MNRNTRLILLIYSFGLFLGSINLTMAQTKRIRSQGELKVDLSKGIDPSELSKKIKRKAKQLDEKVGKEEVVQRGEQLVLDEDAQLEKKKWENKYGDLKEQGWDSLSMAQVDTEALQELLYPVGMQDLSDNLPMLIRHKEDVADLMKNDSLKAEFLETLNVEKYQSKDSLVSMINDKDNAALIEDHALPYFSSQREVSELINGNQVLEQQRAQFEQEQIANSYGVDPAKLNFDEPSQLSDSALAVAKSKYEDHFQEHQEKIDQARGAAEVVKSKQSFKDFLRELVNQDMERVQAMDLKDRFSFGGYFQMQRKESTVLDLSPNIGYKLTGKFSLHVGGTYRITVEQSNDPNAQDNDLLGYNVFFNYQFIHGVYFHAEFEFLREKIKEPNADETTFRWTNGYLFGLGRDFRVSQGADASILILYDFNHSEERPFASPWHVRFGFNF